MFDKTSGGKYTEKGSTAAYTFPKGAVFKLDGVNIALEGITIECFSGEFHLVSTDHLGQVASLLRPKKFNTWNTSICINDGEIIGDTYPNRHDFSKYGLEFLTLEEFKKYSQKVLSEKLPVAHLQVLLNFVNNKFPEDNRKRLSDEIQEILGKNKQFPKNLSLLYIDRISAHTTHIVLSFESHNRCVLHIYNTQSLLLNFCSNEALLHLKNSKINPYECLEKVSDDQSRFIEVRSGKLGGKFETPEPVNKLLLKTYNRMIETFKKLGLQLSDIKIHHSPYNQKNTKECGTCAIQSKLDYISGNEYKLNETTRQRSIRLRAEHAVLSYLLSEKDNIPHFDSQMVEYYGLTFDPDSWYPGFSEVCTKLNNSIKKLPFEKLCRLYAGIEIEETNKLATKFTDMLLSAIKAKLPENKYQAITAGEIDQERADFIEKTMAPGIFRNNKNSSLFVSKALTLSIKQQANNDETQSEPESIQEKITGFF